MFGLFHGLVYLPVLLSFIGPKAYGSNEPTEEVQEMNHAKNPVANSPVHANGKTRAFLKCQVFLGYISIQMHFEVDSKNW